MGNNDHENQGGSDVFARMWMNFAGEMAKAGFATMSPDQTPPDATREMRSAFFKAMSDYGEQYMRSPQFLETMKQSMAGAIEYRKQLNEFLGRIQHEFQATSRQDVDQLMLVMRHLEQRMTDGMERLSSRFDEIIDRLETLEARAASAPAGTGAARSAERKSTTKTAKKSAKKPPKK